MLSMKQMLDIFWSGERRPRIWKDSASSSRLKFWTSESKLLALTDLARLPSSRLKDIGKHVLYCDVLLDPSSTDAVHPCHMVLSASAHEALLVRLAFVPDL